MPNNVIAGTVGRLLREEMASFARHMIENDPDPVTRGIVLNTGAVRTSAQLGRPPGGTLAGTTEFQAIHPVEFGRSGAIKYAPIGSAMTASNPPRLALSPTYPTAIGTPQRLSEWLLIPLKWIMGNLTIDHRQWLALTKGTAVEDFLANWLRDPIQLVHQQLTTDFFGNGTGQLGTIYSQSSSWSSATTEKTMVVTDTVRPFWRGQRVEIYDATDSSVEGQIFMITKVFSFTGSTGANTQKIGIIPLNTATFDAESGVDTIHIEGALVGAKTAATKYGVQGLGNFILNPGDATSKDIDLHGLNVFTYSGTVWNYPELLSYVDVPTGTSRWPTPRIFQIAMDSISDRGFEAPDRWILPRSVRSAIYEVEGLFKTYNTEFGNPRPDSMQIKQNGTLGITSERGQAEVVLSAFCPAGTAYGIRLDGLVRYSPEGVESISFLGQSPLVGGNMFMTTVSSSDYTTVYQAPFNYFIENGCTKPQCMAQVGNLKSLPNVG